MDFTNVPWIRTARGTSSTTFQIQTVVGVVSSRVATRVPSALKVSVETPVFGAVGIEVPFGLDMLEDVDGWRWLEDILWLLDGGLL